MDLPEILLLKSSSAPLLSLVAEVWNRWSSWLLFVMDREVLSDLNRKNKACVQSPCLASRPFWAWQCWTLSSWATESAHLSVCVWSAQMLTFTHQTLHTCTTHSQSEWLPGTIGPIQITSDWAEPSVYSLCKECVGLPLSRSLLGREEIHHNLCPRVLLPRLHTDLTLALPPCQEELLLQAPWNCFPHFYYVSSALGVTSKPLAHSIMIAHLGQVQRSDFISKTSRAPGYQVSHRLWLGSGSGPESHSANQSPNSFKMPNGNRKRSLIFLLILV